MGLALSGGNGALGYRVWPGPLGSGELFATLPALCWDPGHKGSFASLQAGGVGGGEGTAGMGAGCR